MKIYKYHEPALARAMSSRCGNLAAISSSLKEILYSESRTSIVTLKTSPDTKVSLPNAGLEITC